MAQQLPTNSDASLDDEARDVLRQTEVEFAAVGLSQAALRIALDWKNEEVTCARKLSGVRHSYQVFCEQLNRTFAIEEHDGMADLLDEQPTFRSRAEILIQEHDVIRDALDVIGMRLERCLPTDPAAFDDLQNDVRCALDQVDAHMGRESALIQDAFNVNFALSSLPDNGASRSCPSQYT